MSPKDPYIVIGTLVRPHGFPREGVSHFKVHFDFPGHDTLPARKSVWIADGPGFREIDFATEPAPLGGKWSHATGAKLGFFEKDLAALGGKLEGRSLAVPRSSLAPIPDTEIYLADLQGIEVRDENGQPKGHVIGVQSAGQGAWNLVAKPLGKGGEFEFPLKWVKWELSQLSWTPPTRFVTVPEVSIWMQIETLEGVRDDDDNT